MLDSEVLTCDQAASKFTNVTAVRELRRRKPDLKDPTALDLALGKAGITRSLQPQNPTCCQPQFLQAIMALRSSCILFRSTVGLR